MTKEQIVNLARNIPTDNRARSVIGVTLEDWFVVGPKGLELWWQFNGPRYSKFIDPYVIKVTADLI